MYMFESFVQWYDSVFYGKTELETIWILFFHYYLWVPFLYLFLKHIVLTSYMISRHLKYHHKFKYILLAIDAPKKNEQSIIGIELALSHILGVESGPNFKEKWIDGQFQLPLSLEIVSIDGFIQLIIRCPEGWRDIVESAFYAQYPDCEITQIDDYVKDVPNVYPNPTHNMFGVEWTLDNKCFPIRTHLEFEDKMIGATVDPLAGLLEAMSKIGKGEQIWFHLLCTPLPPTWMKDCEDTVAKLTGQEKPHATTLTGSILGFVNSVIVELVSAFFSVGAGDHHDEKKKDDAFGAIWKMSPGDRENLEALQKKMRKPAYAVKMRYGYFAELPVFNKARGLNAITGAMKQFASLGRNGFKPMFKQTATKANYFLVKPRVAFRQKKMTAALKHRDGTVGLPKFNLNVEELATIFHFPSMLIKAPMLKRTESVKREAPSNLPFGEMPTFESSSPEFKKVQMLPSEKDILPEDKRIVIESEQYHFDYDNDEFEKRFALNKRTSEQSAGKVLHAEQHQAIEERKIVEKIEPIAKQSNIQVEQVKPELFYEVKQADQKPAAAQTLPPADSETGAQFIDIFSGSHVHKGADTVFPAHEDKPKVDLNHQEMLKTLPKRPKRYDPEKDTPTNLPFID